jgi:hypothetical protein
MEGEPILIRFSKWLEEGPILMPILIKIIKRNRGWTHEGWCYCTQETKSIPWRVVALESGGYYFRMII